MVALEDSAPTGVTARGPGDTGHLKQMERKKMLKRLEMSTPNSCLNKAWPEEPIFVLRGKDALAAMAVRHWAAMAVGVHEPKKVSEACALADEMDKWRKANVRETASAPSREFDEDTKV